MLKQLIYAAKLVKNTQEKKVLLTRCNRMELLQQKSFMYFNQDEEFLTL